MNQLGISPKYSKQRELKKATCFKQHIALIMKKIYLNLQLITDNDKLLVNLNDQVGREAPETCRIGNLQALSAVGLGYDLI